MLSPTGNHTHKGRVEVGSGLASQGPTMGDKDTPPTHEGNFFSASERMYLARSRRENDEVTYKQLATDVALREASNGIKALAKTARVRVKKTINENLSPTEGGLYARCARVATSAGKELMSGSNAKPTNENATTPITNSQAPSTTRGLLPAYHGLRYGELYESPTHSPNSPLAHNMYLYRQAKIKSEQLLDVEETISDQMDSWIFEHRRVSVPSDDDEPSEPSRAPSPEETTIPGCDEDGNVTDPEWLASILKNTERMALDGKLRSCLKRKSTKQAQLDDPNRWAGPAVEFGEDVEMVYEPDEVMEDIETNPTTASWTGHTVKVDTFKTSRGAPGRSWKKWLADNLGISAWRDKRQNARDAAIALAATKAYDCMDDEHVDVEPQVKTMEYIKQTIDGVMGKRKYNIHHRSANRYNRRVAMVKTLVEELKATAPGIFTRSEADKRALHLVAKQVVDLAWREGVEMGLDNEKRKIRRQERAYYIRAVCVAYHLGSDDDAFWRSLESGGADPLA